MSTQIADDYAAVAAGMRGVIGTEETAILDRLYLLPDPVTLAATAMARAAVVPTPPHVDGDWPDISTPENWLAMERHGGHEA